MTASGFGKLGVCVSKDVLNGKFLEIVQFSGSAFLDLIFFKLSSLPPFKISYVLMKVYFKI